MMEIKVQLPEIFKKFTKPKRYKVAWGGRGGMKSWFFAQLLILRSTETSVRALCTREIQSSIDESVKKLIDDTITRMELDNYFNVQDKKIISPNEGQFFFMGMERGGIKKIKSTEGINICWCEEAENISELSWGALIPTIREDFSEIWVSFNPADEMDATYQRFVAPFKEILDRDGFYEDDLHIIIKVNYWDNPWFNDVLRAEMEADKKRNYSKYLHIWEGECNADYKDSLIKPEWFDAAIDAHIKLGFKPRGTKSMGFDPADEGEDAKAYAITHGVVVTHLDQWLDDDLSDAIDKSFSIAQEEGCTDYVYDGDGIGAGVKVAFRRSDVKHNIELTNYKGSSSVDDPEDLYENDRTNYELFLNKRAQYWWSLRDRFEKTYRAVVKGEYINPDELISICSELPLIKVLRSELVRQQRKRGITNTMIQMVSKSEMKKQGKRSPNLADSVVMSFAHPPPKSASRDKVRKVKRGIL